MTKSGIHNNASLLIRTITIINIIVSLFTIKLLLLEYRAILHLFQYNIKKRKLTYSSFKCVGRQWKSRSGSLVQIFPSLNACTSLNAYTNRHEQTQQIYMHTHTHTSGYPHQAFVLVCFNKCYQWRLQLFEDTDTLPTLRLSLLSPLSVELLVLRDTYGSRLAIKNQTKHSIAHARK